MTPATVPNEDTAAIPAGTLENEAAAQVPTHQMPPGLGTHARRLFGLDHQCCLIVSERGEILP